MVSARKKISLIGAGNIGGTLAHLISLKKLGDVVLCDVAEGVPQGKSLDILQSSPIDGFDVEITGTNNYEHTKDSDAIVVTAGSARKPGMSRDDLTNSNAAVIRTVAKEIRKYSPKAFVIVITNPLDAMVWLMHKETGFQTGMVVGMAGVLDAARFRYFIAQELKVSVKDVVALVLGGHGNSMVPVVGYCSIGGIPLKDFIDMGLITRKKIDEIIQRTKDGGAEIVKLLKTGSAYYAPASSAVNMLESYLMDRKRVLPCAAHLNGEYGVDNLFVGVPAIIGSKGVEKVLEVKLTEEEKKNFDSSISSVRELVKLVS